MARRTVGLVWMLRLLGLLDLCALAAVVAPRSAIGFIHESVGLGKLPVEPVVGYLARCTSLWYVSCGLLLWFVSFDVQRYSRLILFLSIGLMVQGAVIVGIDWTERMPGWWIALEGPCCSGMGAILLLLHRRMEVVAEGEVLRGGGEDEG